MKSYFADAPASPQLDALPDDPPVRWRHAFLSQKRAPVVRHFHLDHARDHRRRRFARDRRHALRREAGRTREDWRVEHLVSVFRVDCFHDH